MPFIVSKINKNEVKKLVFLERIITIKKNKATIDEPVQLYIGDGNVEIQFTIKDNPFKQRTNLDSTYGRLLIDRPHTFPIESEIAKLKNNKVIFIITPEMIDEFKESGEYSFQISLYNSDQTSKATLPAVEGGIVINEPLGDKPYIGYARVGISKVYREEDYEEEPLEVFDSQGNYNLTDWEYGDLISEGKMDKIENAIYHINDSKASKNHNHDDVYIKEIPPEYVTHAELGVDLQRLESRVESKLQEVEEDVKTYTDSKVAVLKSDLTLYVDMKTAKAENDSNSYTDSEVSQLRNDVVTNYALKSEIPTKVSELKNDVPYITEEDLSVVNEVLELINGTAVPIPPTLNPVYYEEIETLTFSREPEVVEPEEKLELEEEVIDYDENEENLNIY